MNRKNIHHSWLGHYGLVGLFILGFLLSSTTTEAQRIVRSGSLIKITEVQPIQLCTFDGEPLVTSVQATPLQNTNNDILLTWESPVSFRAVRILRDGVFVRYLSGDPKSYLVENEPFREDQTPGPVYSISGYTYSICQLGKLVSTRGHFAPDVDIEIPATRPAPPSTVDANAIALGSLQFSLAQSDYNEPNRITAWKVTCRNLSENIADIVLDIPYQAGGFTHMEENLSAGDYLILVQTQANGVLSQAISQGPISVETLTLPVYPYLASIDIRIDTFPQDLAPEGILWDLTNGQNSALQIWKNFLTNQVEIPADFLQINVTPNNNDENNQIFFESLGPTVLGHTLFKNPDGNSPPPPCHTANTRVHIVLNRDKAWVTTSLYCGNGDGTVPVPTCNPNGNYLNLWADYFTVRTTALHELGHAFGLNHVTATYSIMNETLTGRAKQDVWLETPRLPTAEDGAAVYYSLFNETACGN